jgi:polyphosphate kinase
MVRVARLKRLISEGHLGAGPDGFTPAETLTAVSRQVHALAEEQHLCFLNTLMPQQQRRAFTWSDLRK